MAQVSKNPLTQKASKQIFSIFLEAVSSVKDSHSTAIFLTDLLTRTEQIMLAKRLSIAYMLQKGYKQRSISKTLKVSTTTVSKVNNTLEEGKGGYQKVVKLMLKREKILEFFQKIEDYLVETFPPKSRNWSQYYSKHYQEKAKRQKEF